MRPSFASWGLLALLLLQGPLLQAQPLSPALQQLLSLSSQRLQLADQVAQSKAQSGKAVQDSPREEQQLQMLAGQAGSHGVGAEQVRLLFAAQIEANKLVQYRLLSRPLPDAGQAVGLERIRNRLNQLNLEAAARLRPGARRTARRRLSAEAKPGAATAGTRRSPGRTARHRPVTGGGRSLSLGRALKRGQRIA